MRLRDKVVVITGAASGMGRSMAIRFAAEGAGLVVGDRHVQRLGEVVAQIRGGGTAITSATGDIGDQAVAEALVDLAISTHGRIDVLVNNAGIMDHFQGVGELSNDVWRRVLATNLDGPMFMTRRALGYMLKQGGGSIVNIASLSSFSGASAGAAYTASKHALLGLTRNTAWRYAKEGIRCNAICPGAVKTNIENRCLRMNSTQRGWRAPSSSSVSVVLISIPPKSPRWRCFSHRMKRATSMARWFPPTPGCVQRERMKVGYLSMTSYDGPAPGIEIWPAPSRYCDPKIASDSMQRSLTMCARADTLGFDWVSVSEHHYAPYIMTPNPIVMAAAISQVVKRATIALLGPLIPLSNPIRVAEEVAMLDSLSGGRVVVLFPARNPERTKDLRHARRYARHDAGGHRPDRQGMDAYRAIRLERRALSVRHRVGMAKAEARSAPADLWIGK
jgi:NAD(P)-dependent dehydrogenase (short-subunit alcohol dehydrogenase family)